MDAGQDSVAARVAPAPPPGQHGPGRPGQGDRRAFVEPKGVEGIVGPGADRMHGPVHRVLPERRGRQRGVEPDRQARGLQQPIESAGVPFVTDPRLGHHQERPAAAHIVPHPLELPVGPRLRGVDEEEHVGTVDLRGGKIRYADQARAEALHQRRQHAVHPGRGFAVLVELRHVPIQVALFIGNDRSAAEVHLGRAQRDNERDQGGERHRPQGKPRRELLQWAVDIAGTLGLRGAPEARPARHPGCPAEHRRRREGVYQGGQHGQVPGQQPPHRVAPVPRRWDVEVRLIRGRLHGRPLGDHGQKVVPVGEDDQVEQVCAEDRGACVARAERARRGGLVQPSCAQCAHEHEEVQSGKARPDPQRPAAKGTGPPADRLADGVTGQPDARDCRVREPIDRQHGHRAGSHHEGLAISVAGSPTQCRHHEADRRHIVDAHGRHGEDRGGHRGAGQGSPLGQAERPARPARPQHHANSHPGQGMLQRAHEQTCRAGCDPRGQQSSARRHHDPRRRRAWVWLAGCAGVERIRPGRLLRRSVLPMFHA